MILNTIYNENCLDTMARMPDNFIDLTVTSPPYDNLREYNGYSFPFEDIAKELYRVTKYGGVVVWVVGDATINGSETGTSFKQALYFIECGFRLHDTMIWEKKNPIPNDPRQNRYIQATEYMFVFSKDAPKTCNYITEPCLMAGIDAGTGTARKQNGDVRIDRKEKRKGKVVKDLKPLTNVWRYSNGTICKEHPASYPEQLANDHIVSWSNENDLVYDSFMGSGTTAKMAHLQKRNWIGSEISAEYVEIANKRLQPYLNQTALF
jgi:site-specific DNA-methyltransferase (adenine-specific)